MAGARTHHCDLPILVQGAWQQCGAPAAFACLFVRHLPHMRQLRCTQHRPAPGEYGAVVPLRAPRAS